MARLGITLLTMSMAACSPRADSGDVSHKSERNSVSTVAVPAHETSASRVEAKQATNATPPPRKVLIEPKGPIDPKSAEAAGQVVQLFGAYLEAGKIVQAVETWSDPSAGRAFLKQLGSNTRMEVGDLQPIEGAAGSSYTTVPATFTTDGKRRGADIVLRRVNDVPGSTEAQRRWHIERIDLKQPN